jgi:hypothetical protein
VSNLNGGQEQAAKSKSKKNDYSTTTFTRDNVKWEYIRTKTNLFGLKKLDQRNGLLNQNTILFGLKTTTLS